MQIRAMSLESRRQGGGARRAGTAGCQEKIGPALQRETLAADRGKHAMTRHFGKSDLRRR
jgi:hypothetical protein